MNQCEFLDLRFRFKLKKEIQCQNEGFKINEDDFYPFGIDAKYLCPRHNAYLKRYCKVRA